VPEAAFWMSVGNSLPLLLSNLIGGSLTLLGVICTQRWTARRERETKESERSLARNKFQAASIIKLQNGYSDLMTRAVAYRRELKQGAETSESTDKLKKLFDDLWSKTNELSALSERVLNDELRDDLKTLSAAISSYLVKPPKPEEYKPQEYLNETLKPASQKANDRLGIVLRQVL
jgi:hypothetical protein